MGVVYRALIASSAEPVALKAIRSDRRADPEWRDRFQREVRSHAGSRIPTCAASTTCSPRDARRAASRCSQMELLEGETVRAALRRTPQLGIGESLALLVPAMRGVAAAHAQGIVHRDIKPDNLFITRDRLAVPSGPQGARLRYLQAGSPRIRSPKARSP